MKSGSTASRPADDDGRHWHVPPPILGLTGSTGPEGLVILEEVEGELGEVLWRTFRTAATWAGVEGEPGAALDPELAARRDRIETLDRVPEIGEPLRTLASIDGIADPVSAGEAAGAIGRWATAARHVRTGAEFHQLACLVRPSDATLALEAARATRDLADYARAEVWLQRAIGLSRRVGEWRIYIQAHLAYAKLFRRRGNLPEARRWVERALRRANRQGLRLQQARALHDLFAIAMETGKFDRAEELAERALRAYPSGDPGVLRIIHDLAFLWMERGVFAPAMRTFAALKEAAYPEQLPYILGNLARSAGAVGDINVFERSRTELTHLPSMPALAEAWLEVGRGALFLGRSAEARSAAEEARRIAGERREHRIEFLVDDLISEIEISQDRRAAGRPAVRSPRNPALPDAVVETVATMVGV